jgi:hypothetical protein
MVGRIAYVLGIGWASVIGMEVVGSLLLYLGPRPSDKVASV